MPRKSRKDYEHLRPQLRKDIEEALKISSVASIGKKAVVLRMKQKNYPVWMINEEWKNTEIAQLRSKIDNKKIKKGHKRIIASKKGVLQIDNLEMPKEWTRRNLNRNNKYIFVCVDTYTRFMYAKPMKNKEANSYTEAFKRILKMMKLLNHFRPTYIVSDNEFRSEILKICWKEIV